MPAKKKSLIIPVESQRRELDSKLLLACNAAKRGFSVWIGPKEEIESRIASFPRGIYLAYRMKSGNSKIFKIIRLLGHEIVAWDEEALVHLPPEMYFSRRLSPEAIGLVSHLFAWGVDNLDLWRQYPHLSPAKPIHVTGNPRGDLLRPELRAFYRQEAEALLNKHGQFILLNTNFNHVNNFYPDQNLFLPIENPDEKPQFGRSARGMTFEYAKGFREHKQALFLDFQKLIPALDQAFSEYKIILRPHPSEDQKVYQRIADSCKQVLVTNEGNVVPWLMAANLLIHNGCTTAVEAYMLGVPAISYRPTVNDYYDDGFYRLPNRLSHQYFNFEELKKNLPQILTGQIGRPESPAHKMLLDHYLSAQTGPLACERIADILDMAMERHSELPHPGIYKRLKVKRQIKKRYRRKSDKKTDLLLHRYPHIPVEEMRKRISQFETVLDIRGGLKIKPVFSRIFQIHR